MDVPRDRVDEPYWFSFHMVKGRRQIAGHWKNVLRSMFLDPFLKRDTVDVPNKKMKLQNLEQDALLE